MNPEIIVFLTVLVALVKGLCQDKIKICESRNPTRPVCGTNGITYATRCQLLQAMCSDQPGLAVAHRGPCVDKHPCWANAGAKSEGGLAFRPKCLSDGSYAPVQCHEGTGYCWCVTAHGKHISDTSVRNAKPKCNRRGKLKRGSRRGNKSKKTCGRLERANFINNLIRIFKMEFGRTNEGNLNVTEEERDRMAVEWKFATMDNDTNHTLTLDEYKDLRKLVRKVVRPKKCARSFTRYCDTNKDNALSADEWKNCLKKQSIKKIKMKKKEDTDTTVIQESVPLLSGNLSDLGVEEQSERRDEPEVNDCWSDRESVLEEQQGGMTKLYVPECAQDGRYKKIQCYTSTGYCWCVHEDSGKPIPGTSTREPNPKCDAVQPPPRPMKGCSENLRKTFLADIYDFLLHYKESQTGQTPEPSVDEMNIRVKKEQLAQWYFYQLDTNKNKVLERKEWKNFRTAIMPHKRLRRCGKKLPRYCDVNHDRKISITEWYNCLGAQEDNLKTSVVPSQKRKGPNPLESILLDD